MQEIRLPITIALTIELNIVSNNKTDIVSGGDNVTTPVIRYTSIDETLKPTKIVTKKESAVVDPLKPVVSRERFTGLLRKAISVNPPTKNGVVDAYDIDLKNKVIRKRGRPPGSTKKKDFVARKPSEFDRGFRPDIVLKSEIVTCANINCHRKLRFVKGTGKLCTYDRSKGEFCCSRCIEDYESNQAVNNKDSTVKTL